MIRDAQPQPRATIPHFRMSVPDGDIWQRIREEAAADAQAEPALAGFLNTVILGHETLADSLSYLLASKLENPTVTALTLRDRLQSEQAGLAEPAFAAASLPFTAPDTTQAEVGQRQIFAARAAQRDGRRAQLAERFRKQDVNHDGYLSAKELAAPPQ